MKPFRIDSNTLWVDVPAANDPLDIMQRAHERRAQYFRHRTGSIGRVLRAAWSIVRRWHKERLAIAELSALDDNMLRDIGLTRSEIPYAVKQNLARDDGRLAAAGFSARTLST